MKIIKRRVIKKTRMFNVDELTLKWKGREIREYAISMSKTASVLAFFDKKHILLERQYRAPIGKYVYEIPAGHVGKRERPSITARRELKEETGYTVSRLSFVTKFYPSPGVINEQQHLFIAEGLKKGKSAPEMDEEIKPIVMPIGKALSMVDSGQISDAKTVIALLYYRCHYMKK